MRIFFVGLFMFCSFNMSFAEQVSLIDNNILKKNEQIDSYDDYEDEETSIDDEESSIEAQSNLNDGKFNEMQEYLDEENEKIKNIKLLNLDLQEADLILKKKEIESKIAHIDHEKTYSDSRGESDQEDIIYKPEIKLVGIFKGPTFKKATISLDGVDQNVIEGQQMYGILIKKIDSQSISIEFADGQLKNIQI